jgi:hypothetical protein
MAAAAAYDDEDPFCSVCKQKDDADNMLLCSTCNTGNHTHCLGLPGVPAGDYYCSEGCKQLGLLQPGCTVVVEAPQPLYADEKQPHLSQALFCNNIISIGDITFSDLGAYRDIKALCSKAPIRGSVRMYSVVYPHQQLKRLHWEVCKPVEQLYLQQGAELCTYRLVSSRFRAFGTPAAVQGSSTEAWVALSSAAQLAMEDLVASGPPAAKKKHNSVSSRSSAGLASGSVQQLQTQDTSIGQQGEVDTMAAVNQQPLPVSATTSTPLQRIEWPTVRKHMLPPELAMWDPARLVKLCLMASWYCRGSIGACLLLNRRFGNSKAGPKRQQQPDFQADVSAGCWKVVTAGDLHGSAPTLYLVSSSSKADADAEGVSSSDDDGGGTKLSSSPADEGSSGNSAAAGQVQQGGDEVLTLVHRKPRGSKGVLLQLKQLTGYDVRHSVQKCAVQCGIRLAVSAHTAQKRHSSTQPTAVTRHQQPQAHPSHW